MTGSRKPDEAELRARLTDEQYRVTQEKGCRWRATACGRTSIAVTAWSARK